MDAGDILSPVQTGLNIGTALINHHWQKEQLEQNEQWAREDATTAYNRQVEQWNRENAYNTPSAIMQRYLDAGLNPMLAVGEGLNNGNIGAPSVPQATSASGSSYYAPTDVGNFLPNQLINAQIHKLNAEASASEANVHLTEAQIKEIFGETPVSQATIANLLATAESSRSVAQVNLQNIENLKAQLALTNAQTRAKILENLFSEKTFAYRVSILDSQMKIDAATADNIQRTIDATIAQLLGAAEASHASSRLSDAQVKVQDALIDYYNSLGDKAAADAAYVRLQHVLLDTYGDDVNASTILRNIGFSRSSGNMKTETLFYTTDKNRIRDAHPRKPYNSFSTPRKK